MRKIWQVIVVAVVGLGLGLAIVGCGSPTTTSKDKMGTDKMGELSSAMKMNPGESVTVSFAKIKPGQYPYHCTPHLALGMKGVITVQ